MLSGQFCLQLLFKTLFSFIKNAGTCVSKHCGKKKPVKSNKGLVITPFKRVWSGNDGKIQELIVIAQHASAPIGF